MPAVALFKFDYFRSATPSLLAIGLASFAVIVGIGLHQPIKDRLAAWQLWPQPERLTELYFASPNNLPPTYTPGKMQAVSFTTHNLEYRPTDYTYRIVEQSQDGKITQLLGADSFTLQQDQYKIISRDIAPIDMGQRAKIMVLLPKQQLSLTYWVVRGKR